MGNRWHCYPFLILSQESLSDLNKRLSSPVAIRNFRPNIVIKGCNKPYEEDTWKKIGIGSDQSNDSMRFDGQMHVVQCVHAAEAAF